jgi:hypothetical protein
VKVLWFSYTVHYTIVVRRSMAFAILFFAKSFMVFIYNTIYTIVIRSSMVFVIFVIHHSVVFALLLFTIPYFAPFCYSPFRSFCPFVISIVLWFDPQFFFISRLSSISKILEKLISVQLVNHLELNNLLYKHQYGFQRKNQLNITYCKSQTISSMR